MKTKKQILSEAVRNIKSAERFCKINEIKPKYVIIVWEEEF